MKYISQKLNSKRIEEARWSKKKGNQNEKEISRQEMLKTIEDNRVGKRKVTVIEPSSIDMATKNAQHKRVAAYCRVSTQEESQRKALQLSPLLWTPMYAIR